MGSIGNRKHHYPTPKPSRGLALPGESLHTGGGLLPKPRGWNFNENVQWDKSPVGALAPCNFRRAHPGRGSRTKPPDL